MNLHHKGHADNPGEGGDVVDKFEIELVVDGRVSVQFCRRYEVRERKVTDGARGNGELPMNDAQRYRMNAAECILAWERCGPAYRDLPFALAESWLSLARQQEAMDELLVIWSEARHAPSTVVKRQPFQCPPDRHRLSLPSAGPAGMRRASVPVLWSFDLTLESLDRGGTARGGGGSTTAPSAAARKDFLS
jgi:hypothetical protein